jgi:hypothetical protein
MAIPRTQDSLVVRTDFSDEQAWQLICAAIRTPASGFRANVQFFSDPTYDGATVERLLGEAPDNLSFLFVVDAAALHQPEHPVLVIDLFAEPGRTFRVIPSSLWSVENNLSIGNMDFDEFEENVGPDGIFRGF